MFAPDAPKRAFHVEELLIDETALPSEWEIKDQQTKSCMEGPGDEAFVSLGPAQLEWNKSLKIVEVICQYDKTERASLQYDRVGELYVFAFEDKATPPEGFDSWQTPPSEITFTSANAEKSRLACQKDEVNNYWYHCTYFALYQEYMLKLDIWNSAALEAPSLTFDQINTLLENADNKMVLYLICHLLSAKHLPHVIDNVPAVIFGERFFKRGHGRAGHALRNPLKQAAICMHAGHRVNG